MPCCDPPPPEWKSAQTENNKKAAIYLCAILSEVMDRGEEIPRSLLVWLLDHREIDLQAAMSPGSYAGVQTRAECHDDPSHPWRIKKDIDWIKRLLEKG